MTSITGNSYFWRTACHRAGGSGFSPETLHEFLARQRTARDQFHRNSAPKTLLARPVNDPHAA
jgi:hypothetical protein